MLKKLNLLWLCAGLVVILGAAGCGGSDTAGGEGQEAKPETREQHSPDPA